MEGELNEQELTTCKKSERKMLQIIRQKYVLNSSQSWRRTVHGNQWAVIAIQSGRNLISN